VEDKSNGKGQMAKGLKFAKSGIANHLSFAFCHMTWVFLAGWEETPHPACGGW